MIMKKRTITGVLLALFVTPFVVFGTHFIALFVLLVMCLGIYELLDIKRKANMDKMNALLENLSVNEMFEVAITLEELLPNIEK